MKPIGMLLCPFTSGTVKGDSIVCAPTIRGIKVKVNMNNVREMDKIIFLNFISTLPIFISN